MIRSPIFYDKDGNLLESYNLGDEGFPDYMDLVSQLEKGCFHSSMLFSGLGTPVVTSCDQNYETQGGIISEVGNGIIAVKFEAKSSPVARVQRVDDLTTISYIDTVHNVPLGSKLLDPSGNLVMVVYLKYSDDEAKNLEATHQELLETDEKKKTVPSIKLVYDNLSITNHLTNE